MSCLIANAHKEAKTKVQVRQPRRKNYGRGLRPIRELALLFTMCIVKVIKKVVVCD